MTSTSEERDTRIADDIETRYEDHAFISKSTLCEWSDRIRKLAAKEGE